MIKVSVLYPHQEGARFDHAYYAEQHLPLIQRLMGASLLRHEVERGLSGARPGSTPPFVAACHLYCASLADFQQGFGPHAKAILADVPNYTDIQPQTQISEIVVG